MPIAAPNSRDWGRRSQQSLVVMAIVLVIGSLHLAKSAVVPILFAVFLAMLLSPAVTLVCKPACNSDQVNGVNRVQN